MSTKSIKLLCLLILLLSRMISAQEQFLLTSSDIPAGYELKIQDYKSWKMITDENIYHDGIWYQWGKSEGGINYLIDVRYCVFENEIQAINGIMYYSQNNGEISIPIEFGSTDGTIKGDLCWYYDLKTMQIYRSYLNVFSRGNVVVILSVVPESDNQLVLLLNEKLLQKIGSNLPQNVRDFEETLKKDQLPENNFASMTNTLVQSKLKDYSFCGVSDSKWIVEPDKAFMGIRKEWKSTDSSVFSIDLCRFDSYESAQSAAERRASCSTPRVFVQDTGYYRSPYNLDSLKNLPELIKEENFKNDYSFVGSKGNMAVHVHFYNPKGINADTVYSVIKTLAGDIINF